MKRPPRVKVPLRLLGEHEHGDPHEHALRSALERIARAAKKCGLPETFVPALQDHVVEWRAAVGLRPRVVGGDPGAADEFRGWLIRGRDFPPAGPPCPSPEEGRGPDDGRIRPPGRRDGAIDSGRTALRLRAAAVLAARGPKDYFGMRDGIDTLLRGAEWVESLDGAARHFEETGDAGPFEAGARLYLRARAQPGECDPGPVDPFVDDQRGCLAMLDSEIERATRSGDLDLSPASPRRVWADNIESVTFERDFARGGCSGTIEIRGHDFGDGRPDGVVLLLPSPEGCAPADVPAGQWTPDRIWLPAPAWLCRGCVGFTLKAAPTERRWAARFNAVERIASALSKASRACPEVFGGAFEPVTHEPDTGPGCPDCTGHNYVEGPPFVEFTVNGAGDVHIDSHGSVFFSWRVACASSMRILKTGPGPELDGFTANAVGVFEETREVQFAVSTCPGVSASTTYTLIATSPGGCERRASVTVSTVMSARNQKLMDLQRRVLSRYGSVGIEGDATHATELSANGESYRATHFNFPEGKNIRFSGQGLVFGRRHDIDLGEGGAEELIDVDNPSLLLFDDGGRLVGCGFFREQTGANHPSRFGRQDAIGIAPEEWFIHVAGYHLADGGFTPRNSPPDASIWGYSVSDGEPAVWHPRAWDIHVFFDIGSDGAPAGPPVAGVTTSSFPSPPNIPHGTAPHIVDPCPGGVGDAGFFERA
jgi:hypothetical protein